LKRWSPLAREEARTVATAKGVWLLAVLLVLWDGLGALLVLGTIVSIFRD